MQEVLENFKKQLSTMTDEDFKCFKSVIESETQRREAKQVKGMPTCIVAKTIKGKGVSFMENQAGWHGKAPNDEQLAQALLELA